jgi:hypothetical protein
VVDGSLMGFRVLMHVLPFTLTGLIQKTLCMCAIGIIRTRKHTLLQFIQCLSLMNGQKLLWTPFYHHWRGLNLDALKKLGEEMQMSLNTRIKLQGKGMMLDVGTVG